MDVSHMPTTTGRKDSAWEHIENYVKDQRPLQPIRKIVVKGSVDVVFRRHNQPTLIVAGEQPVAPRPQRRGLRQDQVPLSEVGI